MTGGRVPGTKGGAVFGAGLSFAAAGAVLLVARWVYGFAPEALVRPVYAVWSIFIEQHTFAWITNNVTDELATTGFVFGVAAALLERGRGGPTGDVRPGRSDRRRAVDAAIRVQATALLLVNAFTYGLAFLLVLPWTAAVFPATYGLVRAWRAHRASHSSAN